MKFVTLVLLFIALFAIGIDALRHKRLSRKSRGALENCRSTCTIFRALYRYERENNYVCKCLASWYVSKGTGAFRPVETEKLGNIESAIKSGEMRLVAR
jgi:hypothetical protein